MKLATKMRYGTRAMVNLAMAYPEKAIPVKAIAQNQRLSVKYLEHIMGALKAAGLIKVTRGKHGGYTLARNPVAIRLVEVFQALEGALSLVDCVKDNNTCKMWEGCVTRDVWNEMTKALENILARTTLQDLVEKKRKKDGSFLPMYYI